MKKLRNIVAIGKKAQKLVEKSQSVSRVQKALDTIDLTKSIIETTRKGK